ncbi:MAG TPA: sulfatase-like hydrolase/transferase [Candidatus Angelobacter sp.]|jgi:glucan phosphoethanolaminetransferase (alkaline phosphatase superfamily)|nr:sulfatase-like hydrolase/transferase [Candidatus Angelobacter sp.]
MFAVMGSRPNAVFWMKLAAQAAFGLLIIIDSFFLIACYITANFFGTLTNPLFGWLRTCMFLAWILYFPALAAALLSIDLGQNGKRSQQFAAIFIVVQTTTGFVFYFLDGHKALVGPPLLYGPNVRMPNGDIAACVEAFVCLVPLVWISIIHIATAFRAGLKGMPVRKVNLAPFLIAGAATFLLYTVSGGINRAASQQPIPVLAFLASLLAHLAVFITIFLVLQWIAFLARRFSNPAAAEFILRAVAAALVLAFVVRKIVFSLLAFNTYVATLYVAVFSCAVVLFVVALALKIKEHRALAGIAGEPSLLTMKSRLSRAVAVFGTVGLFYLLTIKLAAVDWDRILSSLSALVMSLLLLWICRRFWARSRSYAPSFLLIISILTATTLAAIKSLGQQGTDFHESVAGNLDQYADYDPSFFVIQMALKPAVQDEAYADFYSFLNRHSSIRANVPVPEVNLTDHLKAEPLVQPNIFFLVIDALRRDYLSPYNPDVTFTPHIESFARESVAFQNAYTPYAGTALAEPSIWAGYQQLQKLYPPPHPKFSNLQRMLNVDGFHCYISYDEVLDDIVPQTANVTVLTSRLKRTQQNEFGMVIDEFEDKLLQRNDPDRPVFLYTQPADVHTLSIALHGDQIKVTPHPGFNDKYASAVEQVDKTFGSFIEFLKKQNLYENSIVIVTADHGESLGEAGRLGHVSDITPEVTRIPLLIHVPERLRTGMFWDATRPASLHDLTPTLYYLLGHRALNHNDMLGHPLFTLSAEEQAAPGSDHVLLMSSYMPVFGILSRNHKELFMVNANLRRQYYFDLGDDPRALKNRINLRIRDRYESILRKDLEQIDQFYGVNEKELAR